MVASGLGKKNMLHSTSVSLYLGNNTQDRGYSCYKN